MRKLARFESEPSDSIFTDFDSAVPRKPDLNGLTWSSIGFVFLVTLSVAWPLPVVWINEQLFNVKLSVDRNSFLGREAPSWDVVFWSIAGLYLLALCHGRIGKAAASLHELQFMLKSLPNIVHRRWRDLDRLRIGTFWLLGAGVIAFVWVLGDAQLIALAESVQTDLSRTVVRVINRLSGGMNPLMIVFFFLIAGTVFHHFRWIIYSVAMFASGLVGGALAHILKYLVGRTRPEVWLGPFHRVIPPASSFPSGHTLGAFVIAGVLVFGSRSPVLRVMAILFATAVGVSRVLAFRHWPSDVLASALIGLGLGWFFVTAIDHAIGRRSVEVSPKSWVADAEEA